MQAREALNRLLRGEKLSAAEYLTLIDCGDEALIRDMRQAACLTRDRVYGKRVFIRGLIEMTNYCKNDCLYCGLRRSHKGVSRYRLAPEQVLACCEEGYRHGFRTFVLQGGEDPWFTDERLVRLVAAIKERYPDCAVTLSLGERSEESYRLLREAGADRYLLRHETADADHYSLLHPADLSWQHRMGCLHSLKSLGYHTGCGFMVGSPGQTGAHLAKDLLFLREFRPQMVGIGPFIPCAGTPFEGEPAGTLEQTLTMLALTRLTLPNALLPATTALGTIHPEGRELGVLCGGNVVMPNLSPPDVRDKYMLYNNKLHSGSEAAECVAELQKRMQAIGYEVVVSRGDPVQDTKS